MQLRDSLGIFGVKERIQDALHGLIDLVAELGGGVADGNHCCGGSEHAEWRTGGIVRMVKGL